MGPLAGEAVQWVSMNAPEQRRRRRAKEAVRDPYTAVMRTGSLRAFRRIAGEVRAKFPKPKKGESIARELNELRLRGGKL